MPVSSSLVWDLDVIFAGGPTGSAFDAEYASISDVIVALSARADAVPASLDIAAFAELLLDFETLSPRLEQLGTFTGCHAAADATGAAAIRADVRVGDLWGAFSRAWVVPGSRIAFCAEDEFASLIARPELAHMRGMLDERRRLGRLRLPEAEEALSTELARDGITAWGNLYDVESGALRISVDRGQGVEELSAGQASLLLRNPDPEVRRRGAAALQKGWRTVARTCATALTHITGTRLTLNARRNLDTLDEPLAGAKIERRTLDAMVQAARNAAPLMQRYFRAKARALGTSRLAWCDIGAPLGESGGQIEYSRAADFIVEQFASFSPPMAAFATRAFEQRWIEVEDRPGKRGGGFCADVPVLKQSRIFMTWGNTDASVSTLAHELGHAYHNEVLHPLPNSQRRVPMTLAETASTFAEALVREASRARAASNNEKLRLLDGALGDAAAFLVNIPARFELELALYDMRRNGPLDPDELEATTTRIFSSWHGDAVSDVDPTFWSSKLHFFIPSLAFYNFPYLFGYLFSALVYEHFRPLGAAGAPGYVRLLRRTGDEWAEPIARDELGMDLGEVSTWEKALTGVARDVEAFERITDEN